METRERTKRDIVETITILCNYLDTDRLNQAWKIVSDLATERWKSEGGHEKGAPVVLRKNAG